MPGFTIPWITNANIVPMLIVGCAVALVSFADTDLLSRVYATLTRTYLDVSLADILAEVDETQRAAGITLCVTEMKDPSQGDFKRFGFYTLLGGGTDFPTLDDAVGRYVQSHPVDLAYWENEGAVSGAAVATG